MIIIENEKYLTPKEICSILGKGHQSVLRYIKLTNIPYKKLGREKYIKESDLKHFFN